MYTFYSYINIFYLTIYLPQYHDIQKDKLNKKVQYMMNPVKYTV